MSEHTMITARDPDIVAAEINTIKKNVQQVMIGGALEIGGKLVEAKGMVPHGQWGEWLAGKVNYSQSTAQNLMKLYQEYGGNQQSLFDSWTNSETFGELTYTQHLALLALPFSDRQEFAEKNNAAELSTRELERRVREELDGQYKDQITALEQRANAAEERAFEAGAQLQDAVEDRNIAQGAAKDANKEADNYLRQKKEAESKLERAEKDKNRAERSEQIALDRAEKLQKQLSDAKKKLQIAEDALTKAKENPEIPEAVMTTLRKEAEKTAAEKAVGDIQAQLDEARKTVAKVEREKAAAVEAAEAAAAKLEEIQKASKLADPDMMAIQTLTQQMMNTWNTIQGHRMKAVAADPKNAEPLGQFLRQALTAMIDSLEQ